MDNNELTNVKTIREAILLIMTRDHTITRYRLAKELNLSTSTHIGNYINGVTKKCRPEVLMAIKNKFNIIVGEEK